MIGLKRAFQLYNLGRLSFSRKRYDDAVRHFTKSIEIFSVLGLNSRADEVRKDLYRVQVARRFDPSQQRK